MTPGDRPVHLPTRWLHPHGGRVGRRDNNANGTVDRRAFGAVPLRNASNSWAKESLSFTAWTGRSGEVAAGCVLNPSTRSPQPRGHPTTWDTIKGDVVAMSSCHVLIDFDNI